MPLRVGQHVAAAQTLGTFGDIHKGTPGIVVRASFLGAYDVKFMGGRVVRGLRRDQLTTKAPGFGVTGSGCLIWAAALVYLCWRELRRATSSCQG